MKSGIISTMWQGIKNIYHLFTAYIANVYYGFPGKKLIVIGVTGTSGKTTTTHMIFEVLKAAGYKVSLLSTIKAIVGNKEYDTGFHVTTPSPHILPRFLKEAVENGDTHFVLEASSHSLDQNRVAFIHFRVGVLTSLAHEHLDYHKTFIEYAKAKFTLLHAADSAVLPYGSIPDDLKPHVSFERIKRKMRTFGLINGDETQKNWQLKLMPNTDFNLLNGLAAAAAASLVGVPKEKIKRALSAFPSLPGRYEEIKTQRSFRVIVDFAHKPDALEQVLITTRKELKKGGRIIALFGCASERDVLKRPIMGEISGRLAEITILTDEDPRFEDSIKVINEIASGCLAAGAKEDFADSKTLVDEASKRHIFIKISNRTDAIQFAIRIAQKNDIVLFCGKGHEKSINYKGVETPWSEHRVVREALKV